MYQVVKQTDEEKRKMYSKIPKSQIIDMLIGCNKIIESMRSPAQFIQIDEFGRKTQGSFYVET